MLAEVDGVPMVRRSAATALEACDRVVVVVGHDAGRVRAALPDDPRVTVAMNDEYALGMFASIRAGAAQVATEWFFIVPGDLPRLTVGLYRAVAAAVPDDRAPIAAQLPVRAFVPVFQGRRGHPVLVHASVIPALLAAPPDSGPMRDFLRPFGVGKVEVDSPSIYEDIDSPARSGGTHG